MSLAPDFSVQCSLLKQDKNNPVIVICKGTLKGVILNVVLKKKNFAGGSFRRSFMELEELRVICWPETITN